MITILQMRKLRYRLSDLVVTQVVTVENPEKLRAVSPWIPPSDPQALEARPPHSLANL
jgi:hypothetical protein